MIGGGGGEGHGEDCGGNWGGADGVGVDDDADDGDNHYHHFLRHTQTQATLRLDCELAQAMSPSLDLLRGLLHYLFSGPHTCYMLALTILMFCFRNPIHLWNQTIDN